MVQGSFGKLVAKHNTVVESDIRLDNEGITDGGGTVAAEDQLVLFAEEVRSIQLFILFY